MTESDSWVSSRGRGGGETHTHTEEREYNRVQACLGFENFYSKFSSIKFIYKFDVTEYANNNYTSSVPLDTVTRYLTGCPRWTRDTTAM